MLKLPFSKQKNKNIHKKIVLSFVCLKNIGIGLSLTAMAFNLMRYLAARKLGVLIKENKMDFNIISRIIYPKSKGQRGG